MVRFETAPGEPTQVDWVGFHHDSNPLYAFCATLGYSRMSYVEFVTDMKMETLIACHQHAFETFGGVTRRTLYDNMKTVVIERDATGDGAHHFHAGFLDYARHCDFVIKLCRPYRAKTKGCFGKSALITTFPVIALIKKWRAIPIYLRKHRCSL